MTLPDLDLQNANIWKSPLPEVGQEFSRPRFVTRYELECYIGDGGETCIDGEHFLLTDNSVSLSRPGQIRNSRFPFTARFIYFDINEEHAQFSQLLSKIPTFSAPLDDAAELFNRLIADYDPKDQLRLMKTQAILISILFMLAENSSSFTGVTSAKAVGQAELYNAIQFMKNNVTRRLSAAEMAAAAGYSLPHFTARFRELTRSSPYEYFMSLKIREAQRLLLSGDFTVSEIAQRLSFSSTSHFGEVFRRLVGKTPTDFKYSDNFTDYEIN